MGVLARAELLAQAGNYSGSGEWLDESGNTHHARFGSTSGADTNDPLFLPGDGTQHLYLPGIIGNNARTPDAAVLDISGALTFEVNVAFASWTNSTVETIAGKWVQTGSNRSYLFFKGSDNRLHLNLSASGNTTNASYVSDVLTLADGERATVKLVFDGTDTTDFFINGSAAGSDTAAIGALHSGAAGLEVGSADVGTTILADAKFYSAKLWDDTTLVFDADFTDKAVLTEPFATFVEAANSATVTINRTATGRKSAVVPRSLMLRGTDDYHEVPDAAGLDFAAAESFTLMSVVRGYDVTPAADMILQAKKVDLTTSVGYAFYIDTTGVPTLVIDDGTNPPAEATGPALTDGESHVVAAVRNVGTDKITVYTDGVAGTEVTDSTVDTLANAEVLRFGRLSGAGTNYIDGETTAEVLWREALSDADVITAGVELGSQARSGAGSITETHTVIGAGRKNATDTGAISHGHTTIATGRKDASDTGAISHGHTTIATGRKDASDSGAISHGHTTIGQGSKAGLGTGSISHAVTVVASGMANLFSGRVSASAARSTGVITHTGRSAKIVEGSP